MPPCDNSSRRCYRTVLTKRGTSRFRDYFALKTTSVLLQLSRASPCLSLNVPPGIAFDVPSTTDRDEQTKTDRPRTSGTDNYLTCRKSRELRPARSPARSSTKRTSTHVRSRTVSRHSRYQIIYHLRPRSWATPVDTTPRSSTRVRRDTTVRGFPVRRTSKNNDILSRGKRLFPPPPSCVIIRHG